MRLTKAWGWAKSHQVVAIAGIIVGGWVCYRIISGKRLLGAGHTSPLAAIDEGWAVYQAGPTGWLEVSPDQSSQVFHLEGWNL
jgi:hypothetical protein